MKKRQINLKGLGLKQLQLINRMAKEDLVIRIIRYHDEYEIILTDKPGDNSFESISKSMLSSLGKRRLFNYFGWMPALFTTIDTYSLRKDVKEALGLLK